MPISHALEASHRETTGVEMNGLFPTLSNTLFAENFVPCWFLSCGGIILNGAG